MDHLFGATIETLQLISMVGGQYEEIAKEIMTANKRRPANKGERTIKHNQLQDSRRHIFCQASALVGMKTTNSHAV